MRSSEITPPAGRSQSCDPAHLHEAGDAHDGLVGLVEHLPPGEGGARGPGVVRLLGQEVREVGNGPVGVSQLSVEELGCDVVLQHRLDREEGFRILGSMKKRREG